MTALKTRDPEHDRRQRRLLIGLALLFFAPLGVSFYLYYGPVAWRPGTRVNHGELVDPPRPLPDVALPVAAQGGSAEALRFRSKWTLLYVGMGECTAACRAELYDTRQVRLALNRDMDRVQRVFIAEGGCCDWTFMEAQHPDLRIVLAGPDTAGVVRALPAIGSTPRDAERIYLIDPLGNLMMSYAPAANAKGMLQDLKRLLGLSHVG